MREHVNPEIVGLCTPAAWIAVRRAMERFHDADPEKYHAQRPRQKCPFPQTRPLTDEEMADALEAGRPVTEIAVPCPHVTM